MSFTSDPRPLRTLDRALPVELLQALETMPDEEPSSAELEQLLLVVRARAALEQAPLSARAVRRTRSVRPQASVFHGTLGAAVLFAIGAAAGVVAATGLFFGLRLSHGRAPNADSSAAEPSAAASAGVRSRAPEPAAPAASVVDEPLPPAAAAPSTGALASPVLSDSASETEKRDELGLLGRAQTALETDAGRALALTSDHERKFANGALVQEREVIAIDALLRLGRRTEAQARAERFHRQFPASVHGRRVDVLLGVPVVPDHD